MSVLCVGAVMEAVMGLVLGSLLLLLAMAPAACGLPVPAPDLGNCHTASSYFPSIDLRLKIECCPVLPTRPVKDFSWDSLEGWPTRVRQPAHKLSPRDSARLNRAYQLMSSLPDDDPRSFKQQANLHCAYCAGAFPTPWNSSISLEIHWSWLLMPWHRWFLFFHERILASLLGDRTFALPFWNWDNQDLTLRLGEDGELEFLPGMIPKAYVKQPFLRNCSRTVKRQPPSLVDLRFNVFVHPEQVTNPLNLPPEALRQSNLNIMHQVMVSGSATASLFLGQAYRYGDPVEPFPQFTSRFGTLETGPHSNVHVSTGNESTRDYAEMGNIAISARDPTFYIHHANIDRLWEVWKSIPGGSRTDHTDPDFLDTEFVFYDENADLVRVRVEDSLDLLKMRTSYQAMDEGDNEWITYNASACSTLSPAEAEAWVSGLSKSTKNVVVEMDGEPTELAVPRPAPKAGDWEEVLVLEGMRANWTQPAHLEVFLMLPNVTHQTLATCAELAGLLTTAPYYGPDRNFSLSLGIGPKLQQLGVSNFGIVGISLLPGPQHTQDEPFTIASVSIQLEQTS